MAHFVTLMADGSPQTTPVWIDVEPDGATIYVNTAEGRVKTKNVANDNRVAVSVADSANAWRFVLVRGTIVERRHEGADDQIDRLAFKYLGQEKYPFRCPTRSAVRSCRSAPRCWLTSTSISA